MTIMIVAAAGAGLALVYSVVSLEKKRAKAKKVLEVKANLGRFTDPVGRQDADAVFEEIRGALRRYGISPRDVGVKDIDRLRRAAVASMRLSYWRVLRHNAAVMDELDALRFKSEKEKSDEDRRRLTFLRRAAAVTGMELNQLYRRLETFRHPASPSV